MSAIVKIVSLHVGRIFEARARRKLRASGRKVLRLAPQGQMAKPTVLAAQLSFRLSQSTRFVSRGSENVDLYVGTLV